MIPWHEFLQYLGVFTALVISAFGVPIPEELPIITAGVLVGKEWDNPDSWMKWWAMLPVCIAGVVCCDMILYFIGRQWGTKLLKWKWVQKRVLPPEKKEKIERNVHDYGVAILLVARFLPGIRTPIFVMSGIMRLPFRKFLLADGLYAIPGVNLLFWLSYWFTDQFSRAFEKVEGNRPIVAAVILAAASGFLAYQYLFKRPVSTGDPKDLPVIGKQMATLSHQLHAGSLRDGEPAPSADQKHEGAPAPNELNNKPPAPAVATPPPPDAPAAPADQKHEGSPNELNNKPPAPAVATPPPPDAPADQKHEGPLAPNELNNKPPAPGVPTPPPPDAPAPSADQKHEGPSPPSELNNKPAAPTAATQSPPPDAPAAPVADGRPG
jgi:membrane protein DedA with SNARE-associated domain